MANTAGDLWYHRRAANVTTWKGRPITDVYPPVEVTHDAPDTIPFGETTVTWTATDACGHTGTGSATVTIQTGSDAGSGLESPDSNGEQQDFGPRRR